MKNKIIVGNQKMLMTYDDVIKFVQKFKYKEDVIIIPSNIYISYFIQNNYNVGIQDVSSKEIGFYTSEVSALQAKSIGINYALIGHSETKNYLNETSIEINKKIKQCLKNNIKVILCIGEEYDNINNSISFLKEQLENYLTDIKDIKNIIIVYEPVYSIGTGVIPNKEYLENIFKNINDILYQKYKTKIPLLYGGSVNEGTINNLKKIDFIDGFLIGKASTDCSEFSKIIEVVNI